MAVRNLDEAQKIIDLLVDVSLWIEIVKECALSEWVKDASKA